MGHPRPIDRLSPRFVERAAAGRYADGHGLYLVVDPSGARRWALRVVVAGRRREFGLGSVRLVSLADARFEARRLQRLARLGPDPLERGRVPWA